MKTAVVVKDPVHLRLLKLPAILNPYLVDGTYIKTKV